jgi:hypothetical protein
LSRTQVASRPPPRDDRPTDSQPLALSAQIAAQEVQIVKLTARVAELERRLNRNSRVPVASYS